MSVSDPQTIQSVVQPLIQVGMSLPEVKWPYPVSLMRLSLALALGLLIGLERERRGKEAGLRTFGFVALLGGMGGVLGDHYAYLILALVGVLAVFLNIQRLRTNDTTELTTSAAMIITCVVGILCGKGHTATPASIMVIVTALLAYKDRLSGFSLGLTENEMRSALLLAILAIVIYPALPEGAIGPWHLIEPRAAWVTVILIAGIGFANYVLWKMYGTRGIVMAGFLGGLVNSSITVSELAARARDQHRDTISAAYRGILLATSAMLIRNGGLLVILAPAVAVTATMPFVVMLIVTAAWFFADRNATRQVASDPTGQVDLPLPFSLTAALKFGLIFLVLNVAGLLAQQAFGEAGFYVVSVIGGVVSSASAVAAAATLVGSGSIPVHVASTGAVLASLASVAINLPLVMRSHNRRLMLRLGIAMLSIAILGIIGALAAKPMMAFLMEIVPGLDQLVPVTPVR
ncbi:MAG: MgtC/SapB family protein [Oxalicibacterium faecigallinarum]|uniref:Membrane protein n=1 Tax=Oxalicibacterium faecigallinarum TaxID=573741 RepID=A0A8J3ANG4_9BURK|nr:MgtC/SapB family protein [Oxalicibacterium faecigallinarum]MDQ7970139.1 MgtC/SapB family protein [Oxalicibacterium faecigallinarum]GGI15924.1 membrane protein [Oxalicibacterium faecigallinarum]